MQAKKSLGQNFLMHARIAERIARVAKLSPNAIVFEIGPGTGMLTRELLKLAKKVIALEADKELFEKLKIDFASEIAEKRLELIYGDIRDMHHVSRYSVKDGTYENVWEHLSRGYVVVANIPYYLTGEIFRMFLESENQPSAMTLTVQKEVAERIARSPKESILSLSVKAYGAPKYEFTVPRGAFNPAPGVDSAVLAIRDISRKNFPTMEDEKNFFKLIRAGFAHKRKFVRNNLGEASLPQDGIPEKARAEDLKISDWFALMHLSV